MSFRKIELHGKYATGEHQFAIVDAEDFGHLSRYRWKAKWNGGGNHVYAVRNTMRDGKHITIRMHRDITGIEPGDPCVVDHLNGNSLDNRKTNLRVGTQRLNMQNAIIETAELTCQCCGVVELVYHRRAALKRWQNAGWACSPCKARQQRERAQQRRAERERPHRDCAWCGQSFELRRSDQLFCSPRCRYASKNSKRPAYASPGPSGAPSLRVIGTADFETFLHRKARTG